MTALSPRQLWILDLACRPIAETFDAWGVYLVGTAAKRQPFRDVDVRLIMRDKAYDRLAKAVGHDGIIFISMATGQYLASLTDLPIDFQIQRQSDANELHPDGARNPLGHRTLARWTGDGTPKTARPKSTHVDDPTTEPKEQ